MRLTDAILRASDTNTAETIGKALGLAAAGRFGLLPAMGRSFSLDVSSRNGVGYIDIDALDCLAVTKDGHLIDIQFSTDNANAYDTRLRIPETPDEEGFILTINAEQDEWKKTYGGFEEYMYTFSLYGVSDTIPDHSLPIAHVMKNYGWRIDEQNFVPPCLYLSSHWQYESLLERFSSILAEIDAKVRDSLASGVSSVFRVFWPLVQQLRIEVSQERDLMTPNSLLASVQKCVSAFTCACSLEPSLELEDTARLLDYVLIPYHYRDAYQRIQEGLDICFSVKEMLGQLKTEEPPKRKQTTGAPSISDDQLLQNCRMKTISIPVNSPSPDATVFYSIDGSEPTRKLPASKRISIENGFNKKKEAELDQHVTIKLKAVVNGTSSEVVSYVVTLRKDFLKWKGYEI